VSTDTRAIVIARLRDLLDYLEAHEEPDWRRVGVELEALARTLIGTRREP
jgi:hypothetical protein